MSFKFDPNRPIYLQIIEEIKKRTVRGQYLVGTQLPSVREMARAMGVNPNTMARAYMELERESFISSRRGQGSFICDDPRRLDAERRRLAEAARGQFVSEIGDLGLDAKQIEELLAPIRGELNHDRD